MRGRGRMLAVLLVLAFAVAGGRFLYKWYGPGPLGKEATFLVPDGSTLTSVAQKLEKEGAIASANSFRVHARVLGSPAPVKAGEFGLPAHASPAQILSILQTGKPLRRMVTIPEGMPSVMVYDRLMATPLLTGKIAVPPEGSVLPDSYDYERGESRAEVLKRMQDAMKKTVAELWAKRAKDLPVKTPEEAVTLASIVEKETGKPGERKLVAGLYENRLKEGMLLQADPTIIYPITKGKPLGRRIRQSEIQAVNDYNTYTRVGLPVGPITNPGRASIEAVLHPASTKALYMVADGTGGHVFAETLEQHNANVAKWFAIRKARGDL
ncbi:endolytic transglycosylase MltG [Novosphingobium sp. ZN18A2]|uniref:endolytic transglycosylase MltG n=1 Tax=Novosphingobium sp. ZN18A2 TaxID=3079861 RepID=UPI0030D54AD8